jgi:ATP-dependent helicase/nuclease subunit A
MLKTYEEALRLHAIDFTVVRGRGFFQRQEIVDLGNLLRFLTNPADDLSLMAFLRSPAGHLSDEGIFLLSRLPEESGLIAKLMRATQINKDMATQTFSARDYAAACNAVANLERWLGAAGRMPLMELLNLVLKEGGYYASLSRGNRGEQALSNVEKLLDSARQMALEGGSDLADFSEWLNNRIDYIEEEGEADIDISLGGAVQIMTVHQSKGLEFPLVFVPDLSASFNLGENEILYAGMVPLAMKVGEGGIVRNELAEIGINAPNPDNDWESEPILIRKIMRRRLREQLIAEKKRLLYVAATRAMDHLVLVGHANFFSERLIDRVRYAPVDELGNWLDWINRFLGISMASLGSRGEILYGNKTGQLLKIPYRMFSADKTMLGTESEYRTEFPLDN